MRGSDKHREIEMSKGAGFPSYQARPPLPTLLAYDCN